MIHIYKKFISLSLVAAIFLSVTPVAVPFAQASGLYFIQPDKTSMSGIDIEKNFYTEQKVACEDFQGVIDQIQTQISTSYNKKGSISYQARVRGFGLDTFSQTSDTLAGIKNTTQDYTFTFSPSIDIENQSGICVNDTVFLLGIRKVNGSYLSGKAWGSLSDYAYRDTEYPVYNAGYLKDLYFVVNPANYVPPLYLAQNDLSQMDGSDLDGNSWKEQRIACEDANGVIEQIKTQISTSQSPSGSISYRMRVRGVGFDTFSQVSDTIIGIENTTQGYVFTFTPNIDVNNESTLCNQDTDFLIGIQKDAGSYLSGKIWGSYSEDAYRDLNYPCYECGLLRDMYFVINPANE